MRYEDMEYVNYQHILNSIEHDLDTPSRAAIAKYLGLSRTTVSTIANNLISWGMVTEGKGVSVSRGRPGNPLTISNEVWKVLGAAFYSSSWLFVLCDLLGNILDTYKVSIDHLTPETLVSTLIEGLLHMKALYSENLLPAVGIGVPGVVDTKNGDILFAHDLSWHDTFHVRSKVEQAVGMKVYMRNRYCLAGIAEFKYANPEKEKNVVYIGLGSGINCAIFVDGHLMDGDSFCAGRIAHIQVEPDGPLCNCGKRGCLLTVANERVLLDTVLKGRTESSIQSPLKDVPESQLNVELIGRVADAGDAFARECIDSILVYLNKVISMLVDTLNPGKIVIGGPMGYSCRYLVSQVEKAMRIYPDYPPVAHLRIVQGQLLEVGAALGAASLVMERKLELLYPMFIGRKQEG